MIPKPYPFVKGCTGKQAFLSHDQAAPVAQRMRRKYETGCAVEAYHCVHCNRWHVGQADKKRKRFKREEVTA